MTYGKVILYAYPYILDACLMLDKKIEKRSRLSFYSFKPCLDDAEKIASLIEDKRYLLLLKEKVDKILAQLTDEERILIGYKYFNNRPIDGFDYKSRTYFRKQNRVYQKFLKLLEKAKLDKDYFLLHYANISYIKSIQIRVDLNKAA